jgi:hypothetical protein
LSDSSRHEACAWNTGFTLCRYSVTDVPNSILDGIYSTRFTDFLLALREPIHRTQVRGFWASLPDSWPLPF